MAWCCTIIERVCNSAVMRGRRLVVMSSCRYLFRMVGCTVPIGGHDFSRIIVSEWVRLSWHRLCATKNMTKQLPSRTRQVNLKWFCVSTLVQYRIADGQRVLDTEDAVEMVTVIRSKTTNAAACKTTRSAIV